MPEIEIRPANLADLPALAAIDHNFNSDYVWRMEVQAENGHTSVHFRELRLPRSVQVEYPRPLHTLEHDWGKRQGMLVALLEGEQIGYVSLALDLAPQTSWVADMAVERKHRRQGIGTALVLAALEWAASHDSRYLVLEMQPKNYPAIRMAQKLGFEFCGYNDRYYVNHDIGLFFAKSLR